MKETLLMISSIFPSCFRVILYRLLGAEIGSKVRLGIGSVLVFKNSLTIGDHVSIGSGSLVICDTGYIGAHSEITPAAFIKVPKFYIGRDCKISYGTIIRSGHTTKRSELVLGNLVHIFPFVSIDCSRRVIIGDQTGVGPKCSIFTHSSYKSILDGYSVTYGDVVIGRRVELTYDVFVAPKVKIGDDAICAYGSYVNKDVPDGVMAAGLPAMVKRSREQITASGVDTKQIIDGILHDYRENVTMVNGRTPLPVCVCISGEAQISGNDSLYVLLDSTAQTCTASRYGLFDINRKVCFNHGLPEADFRGFRKFFSRYGIRFITQ